MLAMAFAPFQGLASGEAEGSKKELTDSNLNLCLPLPRNGTVTLNM